MKRTTFLLTVGASLLSLGLRGTWAADGQELVDMLRVLQADNKLLKETIAQRDETIKALKKELETLKARINPNKVDDSDKPDTATSMPDTATSMPDIATSMPDTSTSMPDTATSMPAKPMTRAELLTVAQQYWSISPQATTVARKTAQAKIINELVGRRISLQGKLEDVHSGGRADSQVLRVGVSDVRFQEVEYKDGKRYSVPQIIKRYSVTQIISFGFTTTDQAVAGLARGSSVTVVGVVTEIDLGHNSSDGSFSISLSLTDVTLKKE